MKTINHAHVYARVCFRYFDPSPSTTHPPTTNAAAIVANHAKAVLMEQIAQQAMLYNSKKEDHKEEIRRLKDELDITNHAKAVSMEQMAQRARFQMYMYKSIQMFPTIDDFADKKN